MGELDSSSLPFDGTGHSLNSLLDHLYLNLASVEQRMVYCEVNTRQVRSEHNHSHDGCDLSSLLSLLRLDKHRGYEAFHLGGFECIVRDLNGHCIEELTRD